MSVRLKAEEALSFALMTLATHVILLLPLPTVSTEILLIWAYANIWTSRTSTRDYLYVIARRIEQAFFALPAVGVAVALALYDCLMESSFYVLIWILIWGPTTGLAIFLRFALWCAVAAWTICYFSATTPLNGFVWVPAWYYLGRPLCISLGRVGKSVALAVDRRVDILRVRTLLGSTKDAVVSCSSAAVTVLSECLRRRAGLTVLACWAVATTDNLLNWAHTCYDVLSDCYTGILDTLELWCLKAAVAYGATTIWFADSLARTSSMGRRCSRKFSTRAAKVAVFFGREPGTTDCLLASILLSLEQLQVASEVLALVPFAVLTYNDALTSPSARRIREGVRAAIGLALVAPLPNSYEMIEPCRGISSMVSGSSESTPAPEGEDGISGAPCTTPVPTSTSCPEETKKSNELPQNVEAQPEVADVSAAPANAETEVAVKVMADAEVQADAEVGVVLKADLAIQIEVATKADAAVQTDDIVQVDAAAQTEAQVQIEAGTQTGAEVQTEAQAQIKAGVQADIKVEADAEIEADIEIKAEAQLALVTEAEIKAEAEAAADVEVEAEVKVVAGDAAEADVEAEAGVESKIAAELRDQAEIQAESDGITEAEIEAGFETDPEVKARVRAIAEAELELETDSEATLSDDEELDDVEDLPHSTLPASSSTGKAYTDVDLDAIIRGIASLALSDEAVAAGPVTTSSCTYHPRRIPVSVSTHSIFLDLARPLRWAPALLLDHIAPPRAPLETSESSDKTVCEESCSSLDHSLEVALDQSTDEAQPQQEQALDDTEEPIKEKPKKVARRAGLRATTRKRRLRQREVAKAALEAMIQTVHTAVSAYKNGEIRSAEEARRVKAEMAAAVETAAVEHRAWAALIPVLNPALSVLLEKRRSYPFHKETKEAEEVRVLPETATGATKEGVVPAQDAGQAKPGESDEAVEATLDTVGRQEAATSVADAPQAAVEADQEALRVQHGAVHPKSAVPFIEMGMRIKALEETLQAVEVEEDAEAAILRCLEVVTVTYEDSEVVAAAAARAEQLAQEKATEASAETAPCTESGPEAREGAEPASVDHDKTTGTLTVWPRHDTPTTLEVAEVGATPALEAEKKSPRSPSHIFDFATLETRAMTLEESDELAEIEEAEAAILRCLQAIAVGCAQSVLADSSSLDEFLAAELQI
ncbi:hypothetical protein C8Q77DRAFT_1161281 [Trametes polyzona]|nr:hypothetical protein C8Q77DRAFT_1161281 [Trametes polyzona]